VESLSTADEHFEKLSPVTGVVVARVALANKNLVARAVTGCARGHVRGLGRMPVGERSALLHRVADRIERRFD